MRKIDDYLDLHRIDVDPKQFAMALMLKHIRRILALGGSEDNRLDLDDMLSPQHLELFISRVLQTPQKTEPLVQEWQKLQYLMPRIREVWEQGQNIFQEDLTRAQKNQEEMEYLEHIDFATDCYVYITAINLYPDKRLLQSWLINGYIRAWREHFLSVSQSKYFPQE